MRGRAANYSLASLLTSDVGAADMFLPPHHLFKEQYETP